MSHDGFQFALHDGWHIRSQDKKVFEIGGGKNEHFPGAVYGIEVIAGTMLCHFGPALEVGEFLLRSLGKEVVSKPEGKLSIAVKFVHDTVIVRIVLKSAAGIDYTGDSKTVQFAEELP